MDGWCEDGLARYICDKVDEAGEDVLHWGWGNVFRDWWDDAHRREYDWENLHSGATRFVYVNEDLPFVLKMPIIPCFQDVDDRPVEGASYCDREVNLYAKIRADYPDAADCFAACWYLGDYEVAGLGLPIYAMERMLINSVTNSTAAMTYVSSNWRALAAEDRYGLNINALGDDEAGYRVFLERASNRFSISETSYGPLSMRLFAEHYWGERRSEIVTQACTQLEIVDLHTGNYGIRAADDWSSLCITDYAGFFD